MSAINFSGIVSSMSTTLLWFAVGVIIFLTVIFAVVKIKIAQQYKHPAIIVRQLSNNKAAFFQTKCGRLPRKKLFFGLIRKGDYAWFVKDGREIMNMTDNALIDVFYKKGVVLFQSPTDPAVLTPITDFEIKDGELVLKVANADYRDAAVKLIEAAREESLSTLERILPTLSIVIAAVILLVCIIMVIQFAKGAFADIVKLIGEFKAAQVVHSGAP